MGLTKRDREEMEYFRKAIVNYAVAHGKNMDDALSHEVIKYLHRNETTLNRLACDECNYPTYDEKKQKRVEESVTRYIKNMIGCDCYTQRDPRGMCIRLYLKDASTNHFFNSWDGETSGCNW